MVGAASELESAASPGSLTHDGLRWSMPAPVSIDEGLFARALRAAAVAWQPHWLDAPVTTVARAAVVPDIALPEVLAAWRACERELAGMTVDSPDQELLEANVAMLRAIYQRIYVERMGR